MGQIKDLTIDSGEEVVKAIGELSATTSEAAITVSDLDVTTSFAFKISLRLIKR